MRTKEKTHGTSVKIGDKIRVGIKLEEGGKKVDKNGDKKQRVQYFTGIVISKAKNFLVSHITVRKSLEDTGIDGKSSRIDFICERI